MDIKVEKALIGEKSILRNLIELYNYDFSEFDPEDVDEHGLYGYKYLDNYWTEETRFPFLIKVDGNLAGFVLVRNLGVNISGDRIHHISEFFVMKKYRKVGIGRAVAIRIFDMFKGQWKVCEIENNAPAQGFWRKVICEYTNGKFEEIREADWYGPIQSFVNH